MAHAQTRMTETILVIVGAAQPAAEKPEQLLASSSVLPWAARSSL
jgi:hypothetical protein